MKKIDNFTNQLILAVNSRNGRYVLEVLKSNWGTPENVSEFQKDWEISTDTKNEMNEWYYEAQINVLDNAIYKIDGKEYQLITNEDLWFYPKGLEIPEEWII